MATNLHTMLLLHAHTITMIFRCILVQVLHISLPMGPDALIIYPKPMKTRTLSVPCFDPLINNQQRSMVESAVVAANQLSKSFQ